MRVFIAIAILTVFLVSCMQDINSNSFDDKFSISNGIDTSTAAGQRLSDAYDVLNNQCMSCHTGYHNSWNGLNTDAKWIGTGLIEAGDAYSSSLVIRLKNIGGNMPKDNPQMTEDELNKMANWIDSL